MNYSVKSRLIIPLIAAAPAPAFAQNPEVALTEVRLEPVPLQPPFHHQFGTALAASTNGNTPAISAITNGRRLRSRLTRGRSLHLQAK
jgi:hypothetical protein